MEIVAKPTINNTDLTLANTEYSYSLPDGTKSFSIRLRNVGYPLQLAMISGESNTTYVNIPQGGNFLEEDIKSNITLYFRTTSGGQVAEILTWK